MLDNRSFIKSLLVSLLLIIVISCSSREEIVFPEPELTHTLKIVEEYEIHIDSITAPNFYHYQHLTINDKDYFSLLNRITQEIQFYNLDSKELDFKIPLHYQGPESIGNLQGEYSGYYIHNTDSIFALNRNTGRLYIINSQSEKIDSYNIVQEKAYPSSILSSFAEPLITNHKVYLLNNQSSINYYKRNKKYRSDFATILDLNNASKSYFLSYPESYRKGQWGDFLHRKSWAIDRDKNRIIVSYPIDPYVYEYSLGGKSIGKHLANNSSIGQPRSITKKEGASNKSEGHYYLSQDRYGKMFYDPIRKIYLRDSHSGFNIETINSQTKDTFRKIILLDEDLKKIGEFELRSGNDLKLFFNQDGIHRIAYSENEDTLKFERYELVKISQ